MEINVILTEGFEKWLNTLGYAPSTVYASVHYTRDFFFYLKSKNIATLEEVTPETIRDYHACLQTRGNKRRSGGLSPNYITGNINALKRFNRYLQVTGRGTLEITLQTPADKNTPKTILNKEEIQALYQVTGHTDLGYRDRAMLGIYYGCGLRRSEGTALDVKDILFREGLVFVRAGKGCKQRYVPMTGKVKDDLWDYVFLTRGKIKTCNRSKEEALFLSERGRRLGGNQVLTRIRYLAGRAGISKTAGIHSLRHSVASHLLQSGLTLEEVSRFLGHASLESTQIYTHLAHE